MHMARNKDIIIIDNFDSFTFNISQMVAEMNGQPPIVLPNTVPWREIRKIPHDRIIISPGPGSPKISQDVGSSMDALANSNVPILGVCLGHQCISIQNNGAVIRASEPLHGRVKKIFHYGDPLFNDIPESFKVTRYHSLAISHPLPKQLKIISDSEDNVIMAIRHNEKPHWGVQFHPESICSEYGNKIFDNFLDDSVLLRKELGTIKEA